MVNRLDQIREIIATYERHGWRLKCALLRPETRVEIGDETWAGSVKVEVGDFDALWFARASHGKREAWELRLVSTTQYALFETFEADEPEAAREEVRKEMEARMLEKVSGSRFG